MRYLTLVLFILLFAHRPAWAIVGDAEPAGALARYAVMVVFERALCSGVVMAEDLVLTAAHCVEVTTGRKIIAGYIAGGLFKLADVTEVVLHPDFGLDSPDADVAILKLSAPVPAAFARAFISRRPVAIGERILVVGYGVAREGELATARKARMTTLVVVGRSREAFTLHDTSGGVSGSCGGDSGGPAFAIRGGVATLVGIVNAGDCGTESFVVPFASHRDWIFEAARRLGSPLD